MRFFIVAAALTIPISCDAKPAPKPLSEIHIQIKIKGDGFASPEELRERNGLEEEIEKRMIGEVVDAGSGMGVMDLAVEVADPLKAQEQILKLLAERNLKDRAKVKVAHPD